MKTLSTLFGKLGEFSACGNGAVPSFFRRQRTATQRRFHKLHQPAKRYIAGFTLVEILASLLFLAIAVPAIVGALGVASRASEVAERSSVAGNLAENKLNELLIGNAWQSAAQSSGDFGTDFPNYRWQMATQTWTGNTANTGTTSASALGASTLTELSVEVFYPVQGSEHSVRLTTLVGTTSSTSTTSPTTTSGASSSGTTTR